MLHVEHLFELVNFIFVCVCARHFYHKYGAPLLKNALKEKKAAARHLKEQVSQTQQQIAQLEQTIAVQEDMAQYFLKNIKVWAEHEQQKKMHTQKLCAALQEKFSAYTIKQEKAIALTAVTKEVMPGALHNLRQQLSNHFVDAQEQRRVMQHVCRQLTQVGRHG